MSKLLNVIIDMITVILIIGIPAMFGAHPEQRLWLDDIRCLKIFRGAV